jgi:hypothetical protein
MITVVLFFLAGWFARGSDWSLAALSLVGVLVSMSLAEEE